MAEATPALPVGTLDMRVDVSGATTIEIPTPNSTIAGRTSMNVAAGGTRVDGSVTVACQAIDVAGSRVYQRRPLAISSGPATRNGRAPIRPASVPMGVDSSARMIPFGSPTAPAASAVYPSADWSTSDWNAKLTY